MADSMTAVRVTGFNDTIRDEDLELLFESRRQNIKTKHVDRQNNVAIIDYGCAEVAKTVSEKQSLTLKGVTMTVMQCDPETEMCVAMDVDVTLSDIDHELSKPFPVQAEDAGGRTLRTADYSNEGHQRTESQHGELDKNILFIKNIPECVTYDGLKNYIENKSKREVTSICFGQHPGCAIVFFVDAPDITDLRSRCLQRPLENAILDIEGVKRCHSIQVHGLPEGCSSDALMNYFENPRSCGDDVEKVIISDDSSVAIVTFKEPKTVERVVGKKLHTIDQKVVKVSEFYEQNGYRHPDDDSSVPFVRTPSNVHVGSFDVHVIQFIRNREKYRKLLSDKLLPLHANVLWDSCAENTMAISSTLTNTTLRGFVDWKKNVEEALIFFLTQYTSKELTLLKQTWECISDGQLHFDDKNIECISVPCPSDEIRILVRIIGPQEAVESAYSLIRDFSSSRSRKSLTNFTETLKKHEISYLSRIGFEKTVSGCELDIEKKEVTFTGSKDQVTHGKGRLTELIRSLMSTTIALTPAFVKLVAKPECANYINRQLDDGNLKVSWIVSGEGIEVFSTSKDDTKQAARIIFEELKQIKLPFPSDVKVLVHDSRWLAAKFAIQNKYPGLVDIQEEIDLGAVGISATRDVILDVKCTVQDFIGNYNSDTSPYKNERERDGDQYDHQNTVVVSGFGPDVDQDSFELFFEDETCGGGVIKRCSLDKTKNQAVIEFEDPNVVQRILKKDLEFEGQHLVVKLRLPGVRSPKRSCAIKVTGFSETTKDDTLERFFNNKNRSGGFGLQSLRVNQRRSVALVVYDSTEAAESVVAKGELTLQGSVLSASRCDMDEDIEQYDAEYLSLTAVRITGFNHNTTNDALKLFFQATLQCGGGPLKKFKVNERRTTALVDYGSREVAERVAERDDLMLDGSILSVNLCKPEEDIDTTPSISRAALGREANIGDLYDIRTDNILDTSILGVDVDAVDICSTQLGRSSLEHVKTDDVQEVIQKLDVEPELHVSMMTGLVNSRVNGHTRNNPARLNLIFKKHAVKEEFIISQNQHKIDKDVITSVANGACSATHVILGIIWGTQCMITAESKSTEEKLHASEDDIRQLRALLCRENDNSWSEPVGVWTSVKMSCSFDPFLPDGVSSSKNKVFQGAAQFLCGFQRQENLKNGKGTPLSYLLMPIDEVAVVCGVNALFPPSASMVPHCTKMILSILNEIQQKQQHLCQMLSDLTSSKNYVADASLNKMDLFLEKTKADIDGFQLKLQDLVIKVRKQEENTYSVEEFFKHSRSSFFSTIDLEMASFSQEFAKLDNIKSCEEKGTTYIGKNDKLTFNDAKEVFVFYKPANLTPLAEKVELYFWRCQSSQSLRHAVFKIVDETIRPDLWKQIEHSVVHLYKNGKKVCDDMYEKEHKEFDMCLIMSKVTSKREIVEEKAYVKLRCPSALSGSGKCSGDPVTWTCANCQTIVEYGFKSKNFHCKCGVSVPSQGKFRCNEFEHGVDYVEFPDDLLKDELATLSETKEKVILILGETGVGKSTWINGIFNYLSYSDLSAAMNSEDLLSLIPAQFTYTKDGNSVVVKTGESSSNEILKSGQSATQGTRCYVFKVGDLKVRLIDTPGVGDIRGIDQDRQNFDNILAHVCNYDEIHAVCILLKPNNSRLGVVFRFCIQELLARLHPSAKSNILFCFTNARATFYQPGDTLPSLNEMLKEKKIGLQATPDNYFCFDNEPFRFLVCLQNKIKFDETEITTYSSSWTKVVSETNKLFDKIKAMTPHKVRNTISMNEARRVIIAMSKPMAEVAKTIQENMQLANDATTQIDLHNKSMGDLQNNLKFSGFDLERHELPYPMTVCTDSSCIERVPVGQTNIHNINYKQICHDHCYLQGIPIETTNDERLKNCSAMSGPNCGQCGHHHTQHMHLTYTLEKVSKEFISEEVQKQISKTKDEKEKKALFKHGIDTKVRELQEEENLILQVSAKYGSFLNNNCIIPYNDAVGDYIDMSIDQEDKKPMQVKNFDMLTRLRTVRQEYEKEKEILDESLKSGYSTTPEEVMSLQNELFQLKHFGKTLRDIFDGISISRTAKGSADDEVVAPYIQPVTRRRAGNTVTDYFYSHGGVLVKSRNPSADSFQLGGVFVHQVPSNQLGRVIVNSHSMPTDSYQLGKYHLDDTLYTSRKSPYYSQQPQLSSDYYGDYRPPQQSMYSRPSPTGGTEAYGSRSQEFSQEYSANYAAAAYQGAHYSDPMQIHMPYPYSITDAAFHAPGPGYGDHYIAVNAGQCYTSSQDNRVGSKKKEKEQENRGGLVSWAMAKLGHR